MSKQEKSKMEFLTDDSSCGIGNNNGSRSGYDEDDGFWDSYDEDAWILDPFFYDDQD